MERDENKSGQRAKKRCNVERFVLAVGCKFRCEHRARSIVESGDVSRTACCVWPIGYLPSHMAIFYTFRSVHTYSAHLYSMLLPAQVKSEEFGLMFLARMQIILAWHIFRYLQYLSSSQWWYLHILT